MGYSILINHWNGFRIFCEFMQQFEQERIHFEEMMRRMDSLRNKFLKENFPEIQHNKSKPTKKKTSKTYEI